MDYLEHIARLSWYPVCCGLKSIQTFSCVLLGIMKADCFHHKSNTFELPSLDLTVQVFPQSRTSWEKSRLKCWSVPPRSSFLSRQTLSISANASERWLQINLRYFDLRRLALPLVYGWSSRRTSCSGISRIHGWGSHRPFDYCDNSFGEIHISQ